MLTKLIKYIYKIYPGNKMEIIKGDLCVANVDIIVQQCNCLTISPYGLAQTIKIRLGVCPYSEKRRLNNSNIAIKEDRDTVGTIKIYKINNHPMNYVGYFFSQFTPGKPNTYYQPISNEHIDPSTNNKIIDDGKNRLRWFNICLEHLATFMINHRLESVGFPYLIGCGLAGGNWPDYEKTISDWKNKYPYFKIKFYKI